MDRRQLLKLTAAAVLAGKFINMDEAAASGACTMIGSLTNLNEGLKNVPKLDSSMDPQFAKDFLYWIDGPMNKAFDGYTGDLVTRARLSCVMHLPHNTSSYIESVILADENYSIIAQQYFDVGAALPMGSFAPYAIFENLNLEKSKKYKVIFIQNNGANPAAVYEHTIKDPQPSRFDYAHLSTTARDEHILAFLHTELNAQNATAAVNYRFKDKPELGSGYITTPYGSWWDGPHTSRAKILNINRETGDFEISVDFMHQDTLRQGDKEGEYHYMRYFLVLDPVGRVLGAVRRIWEGDDLTDGTVIVRKGFWTPIKKVVFPMLEDAEKQRCFAHDTTFKVVPAANIAGNTSVQLVYAPLHTARTADGKPNKTEGFYFPADPTALLNRQLNRVNILNCPHIQILTDDKFHALARYSLRLR